MTAKLSRGLTSGSGAIAGLCFFFLRKKTLKRGLQKPEGTVRLSAPIINNSDNPTFDIRRGLSGEKTIAEVAKCRLEHVPNVTLTYTLIRTRTRENLSRVRNAVPILK